MRCFTVVLLDFGSAAVEQPLDLRMRQRRIETFESSAFAKFLRGTLDRSHKGEAAPMTPFQSPSGATVTLTNFQGKPVLLNLWATWCAPCVKEMPTLDALAQSLGDSVQVITLSRREFDNDVSELFSFFGYHIKPAVKHHADDTVFYAVSPRRNRSNLLVECAFRDVHKKMSIPPTSSVSPALCRPSGLTARWTKVTS